MSRQQTGIADGTYNRHSGRHHLFHQLAETIVQVGLFEIATGGNVDDTNVVLLPVRKHPAQACFDVAFRDAPALSDLHQHEDRKSTRLNSSHVEISYAVFCLKKK